MVILTNLPILVLTVLPKFDSKVHFLSVLNVICIKNSPKNMFYGVACHVVFPKIIVLLSFVKGLFKQKADFWEGKSAFLPFTPL